MSGVVDDKSDIHKCVYIFCVMFRFYSTFLKYCSCRKGKETVTVMWYSLSKKRIFAEECAMYT